MTDEFLYAGPSDKTASQTQPPCLLSERLAILSKKINICADAQPVLDPESIERFCQIWAEVGKAILLRRTQE
jgi:hypothetical protein